MGGFRGVFDAFVVCVYIFELLFSTHVCYCAAGALLTRRCPVH